MKKKGLIVATIVMVLVLAVSLTTATYAWFTAANKTIIEAIDFAVGSSSDVLIGVKTQYAQDSNYKTNVTTDSMTPGSQAGYIWGSLTGENDYTYAGGASTWINGTPGLGHYIDTGLTLTNIAMAIGTGTIDSVTPANSTVDDAAWVSTNSIIKAEASKTADAIADGEGAELATPQEDYLDIVLGAAASKNNSIYGINCIITINPSTTDYVLGMNAAIHVRWSLDGEHYYDCDIYNPNAYDGPTASTTGKAVFSEGTTANAYTATNAGVSTAISAVGTHGSYEAGKGYLGQGLAVNNGWASISIPIISAGASYLTTEQIQTIHIQVYIAGYDGDCNNDAIGVSSEILINFEGVKVQGA